MKLCQYSHIFGEPNTGLHRYRFMGLAVIDLAMTLICAYLIANYTRCKNYARCNTLTVFVGLMCLAIFLHWLFCVPTALNKFLGLA